MADTDAKDPRHERLPNARTAWVVGAVALAAGAAYALLASRGYKATEAATVEEFTLRQRVLAQEAARGIEFYFNTLTKALRPLALDPAVQALDEEAVRRDLKLKAQELGPLGVWDVGVIDAEGVLRFSATDSPIEGADFSSRHYFEEAKAAPSSDSRVVELVTMESRGGGRRGLLVGVPMFTGSMVEGSAEPPAQFLGIVACVANLDYLAGELIAPATISGGGHAFLLDEKGDVLWCVDPASIGTNVFRHAAAFPQLCAVAREMQAGKAGTGEFVYCKFDDATGHYVADATERKLIGYAPIRVAREPVAGNGRPWSLGVWAPKADALALLRSARRAHHVEMAVVILAIATAAGVAVILLSRINRILDRRVRERTRQLEESQSQLRETLGRVEASERNLAAATAEYVALMQSSIERVAKIVREIVDFGRPAAKEEWTHTSVERILRDTVSLLRYDRRARKLDVTVGFEPGLPDTRLIEHQLQQVFTNLMVNAFDAMGGQGKLTIRGRRAAEAIEVAIADTGEGMRPEQLRHIFEPFYTTKAGQKGSGLGLALSYSIVQRHGGTIRVESQPGKGSTFTVAIPIRSAPEQAQQEAKR
ncbi:MAG: hypothetical protein FJ290_17925 [Planctomycetes bacterium]|nr:hypothetical protein [Planctomycetota bacterium]